jgi:hypothetical protein
MPATAREADPRVLAGIFSDHRADLPAAGLPPSLLSDLMDQVRCDALSFAGYDSDRRTGWFGQGFPALAGWDDDDLDLAHWKHFWDCASCSYPDRSGDLRSITKVSDFYSVRQWLAVSEGTVRKHLENIYARLQVTSRTAAVTRAFPDIAVN